LLTWLTRPAAAPDPPPTATPDAAQAALTLLRHLSDPVAVLDHDGELLQTNEAFRRVCGPESLSMLHRLFQARGRYGAGARRDAWSVPARLGERHCEVTLIPWPRGWLCVLKLPRVLPGEVDNLLDLNTELVQRTRLLEKAREKIAAHNAELRRLASTDNLTGLANRQAFSVAFAEAWSRARDRREPLAAMLIDVDHFKRFNDTYGHQVGDEVLKLVAAAMRASARRGDLVARYGGEEFVVLLPGCGLRDAQRAAERLRSAVADAALPHGGEALRVTVSIGLALRDPGSRCDDPEALLRAADEALYAAKDAGRNRVARGALSG